MRPIENVNSVSEVIIASDHPRPVTYNLTGAVESGYEPRNYVTIANAKVLKHEEQRDYDKKAIASLDAMFIPCAKERNNLMAGLYVPQTSNTGVYLNSNIGKQPPLRIGGVEHFNPVITQDTLDPYIKPGQNQNGTHEGHSVDILAYEDGLPKSPTNGFYNHSSTTMMKILTGNPYRDEYRFPIIKGPMNLKGWTNSESGYPVPNINHEEKDLLNGELVTTGLFSDFTLGNEYISGWLKKSWAWPLSRMEVFMDRDRGVWTFEQNLMPVSLTMGFSGNVITGSGSGTGFGPFIMTDYFMHEGPDFYDEQENNVKYNGSGNNIPFSLVGGGMILNNANNKCFAVTGQQGIGIPLRGGYYFYTHCNSNCPESFVLDVGPVYNP